PVFRPCEHEPAAYVRTVRHMRGTLIPGEARRIGAQLFLSRFWPFGVEPESKGTQSRFPGLFSRRGLKRFRSGLAREPVDTTDDLAQALVLLEVDTPF